jgi:hypothetical protein
MLLDYSILDPFLPGEIVGLSCKYSSPPVGRRALMRPPARKRQEDVRCQVLEFK